MPPLEAEPQLPPGQEPQPRINTLPAWPAPGADAAAMGRAEKPAAPAARKDETEVFAEDWWTHARPILELHGAFRARAEMFYRFSLGRRDPRESALWPRPADAPYAPLLPGGAVGAATGDALCTEDEAGTGSSTNAAEPVRCRNNTQAGANIRFRLNPELHISDNLRVISQIDLLDNVVLGSTPGGYSVTPSGSGFATNSRSGYTRTGIQDETAVPPRSGINSLQDAIHVKRAWAEYMTPIGELRFGRMPHHWGLGMIHHSGDGYDDDYQTTIDRFQFTTGIKPLDLYASAAWDFPNEGPTSDAVSIDHPQAYDIAQLDDVTQYTFSIARRKSAEMQRLALSRGALVLNAGVQLTYRTQRLAADAGVGDAPSGGQCGTAGAAPIGCPEGTSIDYVRRDAHYWLPDLWVQLLYRQFRFELEAATIQGAIGNPSNTNLGVNGADEYRFKQWGFAGELEQLLVENRLKLGFGFGWASGDPDVDGLEPGSSPETLGQLGGDRDVETFRFNPAYRVDLILFRNILTRVQGVYYFRPSLAYDFMRDASGQRLGGSVAAVWSRASEFIQAPGHDRDLGVEFNAALYFQSKDGALNDNPDQMGGLYARLEYGVLFPMGGLGYAEAEAAQINANLGRSDAADVSTAQTVRLFLGVLF